MASLPSYACVMLDGYEESPNYNVLRTSMDGGLAKQRARNSIAIVTRSVKIKVGGKANKILFDTWFKDDLNGGVGWFDYVDPITSTTKQARFVSGELSWSSPGVIWMAAAKVETLG